MRYLIFPLLLGGFNCIGQLLQGNWTLGANVVSASYSTSKDSYNENDNRSISFSLSPGCGYFVTDNLLIGASISHSRYWNRIIVPNEATYRSRYAYYGIGPNLDYYIGKGTRGRPYLNLNPSVGLVRDKSTTDNSNFDGSAVYKSFSFSLIGGVGYAYFINRNFMARGSICYSYYFSKYQN